MIWHDAGSPGVIVMLTQTHEAGREKCYTYFPLDMDNPVLEFGENEEGEDSFRGSVELLDLRDDEKTRSTVRKLCLKVEGEEKIIWHYLFVGWPDFSVPDAEDRLALLELVKQSAVTAEDTENARVVHCSAGVGRSGTFIALDYLLSELNEGSIDELSVEQDRITDTVNELRKQRMMMVQGEAQFVFLYDIVKEQWLERHGLVTAAEEKKQEIIEDGQSESSARDDSPIR